MIELREVVKSYGSQLAVDHISFEAKPGEVFGLIGPNGAGKSTTIRMIMNILRPDAGEILIDGHPIAERDKQAIGYLPQERGLYRKIKVGEMLSYLGELKGMDRTTIPRAIDRWLSRFELLQWKDRKIDELSKGMTQKVQFIGSILHDPGVCFFDEPFSGLDPVSADALIETVLDLGRHGKTVLLSTHLMDHAERLCNRIFIIDKGREVASGPLSEVKRRFGKRAVAVEYDGDAEFVTSLPFVENIVRYPRWMEVELKSEDDAQSLYAALAGKVTVRRFEVLAPSLHKIFVDLVRRSEKG